MKRSAEVLTLGENGPPAQARLKSLERQLLEKALVVRDRKAPLGVVIRPKCRCRSAPAATRLAVVPEDCFAHAREFAPGASKAPLPFWRVQFPGGDAQELRGPFSSGLTRLDTSRSSAAP